MRVVIQRVSRASVSIDKKIKSSIQHGLVILLGIESTDGEADIDWLTGKIVRLRVFDDETGVMNKCVSEIAGDLIVVSQFTLHASTKKGNRPSYVRAAAPEFAKKLYGDFLNSLELKHGKPIKSGEFGAMMELELVNSGPVTIIIDSKNKE